MKEKLDRLSDALIDNIINTSDEEILQEVKEEYGDHSFIAKKMRKMITKIKLEVVK